MSGLMESEVWPSEACQAYLNWAKLPSATAESLSPPERPSIIEMLGILSSFLGFDRSCRDMLRQSIRAIE